MSTELTRSLGFPNEPTKVIGIGKAYTWNYPGEKKPDVLPEPLTFLRPPSSLAPPGQPVLVPRGSSMVFEVEIAVVVGKRGKNIRIADASSHIGGYALALDMCSKTVQDHARANGLPWAICKGADTLSPISRFIELDEIDDPHNIQLKLEIDGKTVCDDTTQNLIYSIDQEIAFISSIMTLNPGDIILTGAPKGVSTVTPGSHMVATLSLADGKVIDSFDVDVEQSRDGYEFGRHWTEWLQ